MLYTLPCATHPEDLKRIADFLNLSLRECLKRYFILDYYSMNEGDWFYICPKRKGDTTNIANYQWAFDSERPCIFLTEDNKCQIHGIQPKEGRLFKCWEKPHTAQYSKKEAAIEYHKPENEEYIKMMEDLLWKPE